MKRKLIFYISSIIVLIGAGCTGTRNLGPDQKLYTGAEIRVEDVEARSERKAVQAQLSGLPRPKPNTKFLFFRPKLSIYNTLRKAKPNSFFGKLRDRFGEPPVLMSDVNLENNVKILKSQLENKGWFNATLTGDTIVGSRTGRAVYTVTPRNRYSIRNVAFPTDSSDVSKAIAATAGATLLKPGEPFDLDVIKAERIRIDAQLKERGFYFFGPDYILVRTDSTVGNSGVNMQLVVKNDAPDNAQQIYTINDVFVYTGYSLNAERIDTSMSQAKVYEGVHILDRRNRYKPRVFLESLQFHPGEVYNRTDHNMTLNRLINLNLFKFVKNRFEVAPGDSPRLNAYYYLTPEPRQSLRAEFGIINRSNNLNGSQINLSWSNRNVFRNGSQVNVTAYVGSDVQFSGTLSGYNTYRTGAEVRYVAPRFFTPFFRFNPKGPYAPRTNIVFGYDVLNRQKLYTLNSYRLEYGYTWKESITKLHQLFPISISYVQPLNITQEYRDLQAQIFGLERAVEPQFILGSRYEFTYNELAKGNRPLNAFFFNGLVDLSGNIAGLVTGANAKRGDSVVVGNVPFAQYIKLQTDFRYYRRIGLKSSWANRIDVGFGIPYGNSLQVPYIKQFFIGGNNSLRGFRSRSVGPGTYFPTNASQVIPDQTGDIKLELNTEFRPHLFGPFYGALFLEGGNIWLRNDSTYTGKPGSQFTGRFLSQLAVDAGVGLRLDITLFVIRLDVAFPLRKPWEVPPSVLNQVNFRDADWRRQNIVYNLAIGYPF